MNFDDLFDLHPAIRNPRGDTQRAAYSALRTLLDDHLSVNGAGFNFSNIAREVEEVAGILQEWCQYASIVLEKNVDIGRFRKAASTIARLIEDGSAGEVVYTDRGGNIIRLELSDNGEINAYVIRDGEADYMLAVTLEKILLVQETREVQYR